MSPPNHVSFDSSRSNFCNSSKDWYVFVRAATVLNLTAEYGVPYARDTAITCTVSIELLGGRRNSVRHGISERTGQFLQRQVNRSR